jgi:PAS domain S-box-containing protein
VRPRVLFPLVLTLLFVLSLFILFGQVLLERDLDAEISLQMTAVETLFDELLHQRAEAMMAAISQLAVSEELQDAMRRGDRDLLRQRTYKHFNPLLLQHDITFFYFHLPDRSVFLRMHQPQLFGDEIHRTTLIKAGETQAPASGIELGVLGNLSLRSVSPWRVNGEVIGYIELGREIRTVIHELSEIEQTEIILLLRKEHLERGRWEEGMRRLGQSPRWDLLPERVVIASTLAQWHEYPEILYAETERFRIEVADDRTYQGAHLPLRNADETVIGSILVLRDVTERLIEFRNALLMLVGACLALGGALFVSSYITLGRADRRLTESRRQLLDQIESTERAKEELEVENSERRLAERQLHKSRQELERRVQERTTQLHDSLEAVSRVKDQLQGILSSVQDVLIAVDAQGRVLQMNAAAEELLGIRLGEARCRHLGEIAPPFLQGKIQEALTSKSAGTHFDFEISPSSGQEGRVLQAVTSVIGQKEGSFGGMIVLARDMTRERQIDRIKSEFISTAAHELRTPVTSILGFSELLLQTQDFSPEEQAEFLAIIHEKAEALSALIDDLLDVSRIEAGKALELHRSPISVKALVTPVVWHYQKMVSGHAIELILDGPGHRLDVDKGKVIQVMENLLSNAVKYSPRGGAIRVAGEKGGEGEYRFSVADHGIGMTQEQVERMFEKFFRADTTDSAVPGTGLGTTIVKSIIEAHGGKIWVQSEPGKGTTVNFTLPLCVSEGG